MATASHKESSRANGSTPDFRTKAARADREIEQMTHSAGEKIGEMASRFVESGQARLKAQREYIQENPVKGVAIAAAAGLVVGSLLVLALRRR